MENFNVCAVLACFSRNILKFSEASKDHKNFVNLKEKCWGYYSASKKISGTEEVGILLSLWSFQITSQTIKTAKDI